MDLDTLPSNPILVNTPAPGPGAGYGAPAVTGYEILGELGRGGMGVVFFARQIALNRPVALKMVRGGARLHESDRIRFLAEAEAVAAIKHPNVVQVYEFGQSNGLPYFAMEFVDGGSLAHGLFESGPLTPVAAARLLSQVARGVQAAHDVGVVHRDLKPANILLSGKKARSQSAPGETEKIVATPMKDSARPVSGADATPKVTDFGIAKRGGGVDLTMTGMVIGTPAYMAPEQAAGNAKFVGPAADIYALGVILFECLTGRTPFIANESQPLLLQVVQDEAPTLGSVAPTVPRDLDLICSKCLSKQPHDRYPSAEALAADLDRFAAGEPVSVRPPGRLEKAVRWTRKYPARAAVYGLTALAVLLFGLTGGALGLWQSAEKARGRAESAQMEAEDARGAAQQALAGEKNAREGEAAALRSLAATTAARDVDFAYREYEAANIDYARSLLDQVPVELRTWEWNYVARVARREAWTGKSPGGALVGLGFAPNGDLVTAGAGGAWIWDGGVSKPARLMSGDVRRLVVSGNGTRAALRLADKTLVIELPSGKTIAESPYGSLGLAFDNTGEQLLLVEQDAARHFNPATGAEVKIPLNLVVGQQPAFDPPGRIFGVGGLIENRDRPAGKVHLFDVEGNAIPSDMLLVGGRTTTAIAFSPGRPLLAAANEEGVLMVFGMESGEPITQPTFLSSRVNAVAFSPDGQWLGVAGEDRVVRAFHLDEMGMTEAFVFKGHGGPVTGLAFTPNGNHLVSVSVDGTIRYWSVTTQPDAVHLPIMDLTAVLALPGGMRVMTAAANEPIAIHDLLNGGPVDDFRDPIPAATGMRLDPRTRRVTLHDGTRAFIELPAPGARELAVERGDLPVAAIAASSNGKRLVNRTPDGAATVYDASGKVVCTTAPHPGLPRWTTISPDGSWVVTGGSDRAARVWDAQTGRELMSLTGHNSDVTAASVSPDRARIATASRDGVIKVWDGATGRVRLTFPSHKEEVTTLSWSPDGAVLIAGNRLGVVQVFDGSPPGKE